MATTTMTAKADHAYVVGTITCQHCRWAARMSSDTLPEVADFLQRRLVQHVEDHHGRDAAPTQ